ncbi:MAG: ATP-dependent metallopeptidase FtsH/Yme1/Tma family protein, partial [Planctomycetota bacterium]
MNQKPQETKGNTPITHAPRRSNNGWWILLIVAALFAMLFLSGSPQTSRIDYSFFLEELERGNIRRVIVYPTSIEGTFTIPPDKPITYDALDKPVKPKKLPDGSTEKLYRRFMSALPAEGEVRRELFAKLEELRTRSKQDSDEQSLAEPFVYDVVSNTGASTLY